jgi:glycosyltransferase involved in cell wall biosynthesis
MKIALIHFRTGQTDGVSLEMDKWRFVLEKMGHQVRYISGSPEADIYLPELNYKNPQNEKFVRNAYQHLSDYQNETAFKTEIMTDVEKLNQHLKEVIKKAKFDLLIPNNIFSLGWNIPAALALAKVIREFELPVICHHHDFYWERELYSDPSCNFIAEILADYFPPSLTNSEEVVINSLAQAELKKRKGLKSTVVPNVFNFQQQPWQIDSYNYDLRSKLGIKADDIIILHATRIAERKAIELAIETAAKLARQLTNFELYDGRIFGPENEVVFLLPGLPEAEAAYLEFLKQMAADYNLKLIFANQLFAQQRQQSAGQKIYSFWDSYVIADLITYTSIKEGWGNQLLEALFAQKPLLIFEYPVFRADLSSYGLKLASLGSDYQKRKNGYIKLPAEQFKGAIQEAIKYLKDTSYRSEVVAHNFAVGARYFSYQRLENLLEKLLAKFDLVT